jgi:endonuclease G, mitochondrial
MPSAAMLHAACFAAGAVVGGGLVTVVSSKKRQIPVSFIPAVDSRKSGVIIPPIVEVGMNGDARITNAAAIAFASPVLKYGNPGMGLKIFAWVCLVLILISLR